MAIIYPPKTMGRVKVAQKSLKFIVAGMEAVSEVRAPLGFLTSSTGEFLAVARTVLEPRDAKGRWLMVFDLTGVLTPFDDAKTFTIVIRWVNENGEVTESGPALTGIKFIPSADLVGVTFPPANCTHPNRNFSPYGELTHPDTRIEWVKLRNVSGSTEVEITVPGSVDPDLFWYATFDEVLPTGGGWELRVQGNYNLTVVGGLTFTPTR